MRIYNEFSNAIVVTENIGSPPQKKKVITKIIVLRNEVAYCRKGGSFSLNANHSICSFAQKSQKRKNEKKKVEKNPPKNRKTPKLFYSTVHGSCRKRPSGRLSIEVH